MTPNQLAAVALLPELEALDSNLASAFAGTFCAAFIRNHKHTIIAAIKDMAAPAEKPPLKLHFDNDYILKKIDEDGDYECGAGTAPTPADGTNVMVPENTVIGACNILDTTKVDLGDQWSEWDQSIRDGLSAALAAKAAAPPQSDEVVELLVAARNMLNQTQGDGSYGKSWMKLDAALKAMGRE